MMRRREFLAGAASLPLGTVAQEFDRPAAVAFDGFTLFDPRPVARAAEQAVPGRGMELMEAWRLRHFQYQWLRTLMGRYANFLDTADDALQWAAASLRLGLDANARARLVDEYREMPVWPDVPGSVARLKAAGLRLAVVSNMTQGMLEAGLSRNGLAGQIDGILSADRLQVHKPAREMYVAGAELLGLQPASVLFAPFAAWDAAGAAAAGHPVFWVNRSGMRSEELGAVEPPRGRNLADLVAHLGA